MEKELAKYSASNSFQTRHETAVFAYSSSAIFLACAWSIFNHDWEWDYVDVMTFIIVTWFTTSLSWFAIWFACCFCRITDLNLTMRIHWWPIWMANKIEWSKTESRLMGFTILENVDIIHVLKRWVGHKIRFRILPKDLRIHLRQSDIWLHLLDRLLVTTNSFEVELGKWNLSRIFLMLN